MVDLTKDNFEEEVLKAEGTVLVLSLIHISEPTRH